MLLYVVVAVVVYTVRFLAGILKKIPSKKQYVAEKDIEILEALLLHINFE